MPREKMEKNGQNVSNLLKLRNFEIEETKVENLTTKKTHPGRLGLKWVIFKPELRTVHRGPLQLLYKGNCYI